MENRTFLWRSRRLWVLALLGLAFSLQASTITVDVNVPGTTMPWQFNTTTFNNLFQYGLNDGTPPVVVGALSGISFAQGGILTISFLAGSSCDATDCVTIDSLSSWAHGAPSPMPGVPSPYEDARGYTPVSTVPFAYDASNNPGTSGKDFPSFYMNPASYPIYLGSLVGVFTDASGNIVSTPFVINNGPVDETVPSGAAQLQLGIDDDIFFDNNGVYSIQVQSDPAPEPGSFLLIGFPILALGTFEYRRRAAAKARA